MRNIWREIDRMCIEYETRLALTDYNQLSITYRQLRSYVYGGAKNLRPLALPGATIAILMSNPYWEGIYILAGLAAGYVVIPLSMKYGVKQCSRIIAQAKPLLIVTDEESWEGASQAVGEAYTHYVVKGLTNGDPLCENLPSGDEVAFIMYTSGTTGVPKGVMLSHSNVLSNLDGISQYFAIAQEDSILIMRPLLHAAVLTGEFLISLYKGLSIAFYTEPFSPRRILSFITDNNITVACATPTIFGYFATACRTQKVSSLRIAAISGERLTESRAAAILTAFPYVEFYHVYGLTEASPRVCFSTPELFRRKPSSVGQPLNNIETRIVDINGKDVQVGIEGELIIRGKNVMLGYLGQPNETNEKIVNGWLHTGDKAFYDEEGMLFILGRSDEMIIRAGMNIYPQEIENILLSSPMVSDVRVYGVNDDRMGEMIVAEVVCDHAVNLNELNTLCRENLPDYMWPAQIICVKAIDRGPSGKVIRRK